MDQSNFVTYDKKESLLLSIAKSNLDIVENTLCKPQETLEFKMIIIGPLTWEIVVSLLLLS